MRQKNNFELAVEGGGELTGSSLNLPKHGELVGRPINLPRRTKRLIAGVQSLGLVWKEFAAFSSSTQQENAESAETPSPADFGYPEEVEPIHHGWPVDPSAYANWPETDQDRLH